MEKNMKIFVWAFILVWFSGISFAGELSYMKCNQGSEIVSIGDHSSVVLAKCGEPISVNQTGSKTRTRAKGTVYQNKSRTSKTRKNEKWTYCIETRFGGNCYLYVLTFRDDTVYKITSSGKKGSNPN